MITDNKVVTSLLLILNGRLHLPKCLRKNPTKIYPVSLKLIITIEYYTNATTNMQKILFINWIYFSKGNRLSFEAFHGALLISLYQDEPEFQNAYKTVKLVMDVDAAVSKWRRKQCHYKEVMANKYSC